MDFCGALTSKLLDSIIQTLDALCGLFSCSFPGATNETLLDKLHAQHSNNASYEVPQMKESAFSVVHYAGKVKYHIQVSGRGPLPVSMCTELLPTTLIPATAARGQLGDGSRL